MRTVLNCLPMILAATIGSFAATGCATEAYRAPEPSADPTAQFYRAETIAACDRVCVQEFEAHCSTWPAAAADCRGLCEEELGGLDDQCMNQADAWYECLWFHDATCNGGGVTHGRACDPQYDAFIACIQAL